MGKNKKLRKQIGGYELQLALHHEKVAHELEKSQPDYGRINIGKAKLKG